MAITAQDSDPRVGDWLRMTRDPRECDIVLIGFPSDEGVKRNGGRTGAARAPAAIREALNRLTPDAANAEAFTALLERTVDLGDLTLSGDLEQDQEALGHEVASHLVAGRFPIILGGGHEVSYGHFLGYVKAGLSVEILNVDAHADVRPLNEGLAHSGSPFRQALEHPSGVCRGYAVAGLQPHSTAASHADYVRAAGGELIWRDGFTSAAYSEILERRRYAVLATFDMDAVAAAAAPGVSAPNPSGLPVHTWLAAAYAAGSSSRVSSFDIAEVNPDLDVDGRTARLAALTVWQLLRGFAGRKAALLK